MLVVVAKQRGNIAGWQLVNQRQRSQNQRTRCRGISMLLQMPGEPRKGPVHSPVQRADRGAVPRSGIAPFLQTATQHLTCSHVFRAV